MSGRLRGSLFELSSYVAYLSLVCAGAAGAQPPGPADPLEGVSHIRSKNHAAELMEEVHSQRRASAQSQTLVAAYYRLTPETETSVWLLDQFIDPIELTITAFNRLGGRFPLGTFVVQPRSFLQIDLAEVLDSRATGVWQEGSLHVEYFGDPDMLAGWTVTRGTGGVAEESLIHLQSLAESRFTSFWDTAAQALSHLTPIYELHNAGDLPVRVSIRLGHGKEIQEVPSRMLAPGSTTRFLPSRQTPEVRGWVEFSHDGDPGDLVVSGRLEGQGFLSRLPVVQDRPATATRAYEALRVPLSGPEGKPHYPLLVVLNTSNSEQSLEVSWLDRTSGTILAQLKRAVPARETFHLDSLELTTELPLPLPGEARLKIETDGSGLLPWGVVIPEAGPPLDLAIVSLANGHPSGMYPLPNLSEHRVFTTLSNLGLQPAEVLAQVTWKEGSYALEPLVIPPGASRRLDFQEIALKSSPDVLGRTLDPGFESGFFQWLSHRGSPYLLARTEVQPKEGAGIDAFGFNCLNCCVEVPYGELVPGTVTFPVGQSPLFQTCVGYNTCTGTLGPYYTQADSLDYPAPFSWDGVNISASAAGTGTASFLGSELGTNLLCALFLFTIQDEGPVKADPICEIKTPSSVKIGEASVAFQTEVKPAGTVSNWRLTQGDGVCMPLDSTAGKIGARAAVSAKAQMTCTIDGQMIDSNQFDVQGSPTPQFVNVMWSSAASQILAQAFPNSTDQAAVRSRVRSNLAGIFSGSDVRFSSFPSQGVTKITTLQIGGDSPGSQGGEASYDRLNFSRANSGSVFVGAGSLNIASSSDPVPVTSINERRSTDRVADAVARLAAHELAHMLGLVPISSELTGSFWGNLAVCHGVSGLGLSGSPSHHNSSFSLARIMNSTADLRDTSTWNVSLYSFTGTNRSYLQKVLP